MSWFHARKELYRRLSADDPNWGWNLISARVKRLTWLVGLPAFGILVWHTFTDSVSETAVGFAFAVFLAVALIQVFSLYRATEDRLKLMAAPDSAVDPTELRER
jgi:hypothetical protein